MQVSRQLRHPEVLWSDQATSAVARFHHMPVDGAICTAVMSRDHNTFSWPDKSLDQFSVSSGVQGDNATSMVITGDAHLGLAANHWLTTNDFPHTTSSQRYQSYCDQQSFVPYSRQPAHFKSSTGDSVQWYEQTRPKTRYPAIPNSNDTPAHAIGNVFSSLSTDGIDPCFLARHSQDDYFKNPEKVTADLNNRIIDVKSCMRGPLPGYDARPLLPDHSVVNGGLPAYNWADPPHRRVTVGPDYRGLPLDDSQTQQSGSPKYSASSWQQAAALSNHPTGADGGFPPAHSGSDYSSYSPLQTSGEVVKTTEISATIPAKPEQHVDEPASESSSPDVSLTSTATFDPAVYESDSDDSLKDLEVKVEEACAFVERVLREREERKEFEANLKQRENAIRSNHPTGAAGGFLPALSGSNSSLSPLETSEEVVKTTCITTDVPANPEQPVDEPASGSPDVSLTSAATFDTAVCESNSDDSLKDLHERVEEACAMVAGVLREREEREEFEENLRKRENKIRADRRRAQQARDEKQSEYSLSWPTKQEAVTTENIWLCEHYQRRCRIKFECCNLFYACHRCHNESDECSNAEVKAFMATHYKCSYCHHEEEIDENAQRCSSCNAKMSAYFCAVCKHFTSTDKNPYHCKKCGICRIHKDKSFHCDVCNVCLDIRLKNKHKCRPNSGHDECPICLEDAFSGCQILPCSHKVHRECAIAMIQNGVRHCPVCRHSLYSPSPD